jgi:hypothetical protein
MLLLSLRRAIYLAYVLILLHETCLTATPNAGVERQQPHASEGLLIAIDPSTIMITEILFFKQNTFELFASSKRERDAGVVRSNDLLGRRKIGRLVVFICLPYLLNLARNMQTCRLKISGNLRSKLLSI